MGLIKVIMMRNVVRLVSGMCEIFSGVGSLGGGVLVVLSWV